VTPLAEPGTLLGLSVALGIGLGVGAERERRKGRGAGRAAAGIRTFTVAALLGAVAQLLGGAVLAVAVAGVGALAVLAYRRSAAADPGLTTEVALLLTSVLGALAMPQPALAAAVAVVLAGLLAARERLHRFVRRVLAEQELHDAILLLAAALIALPLAPDRYLGPLQAVNPHAVARLVVLVLIVGALAHVAVRAFGEQRGLPLAGLAGGFVSSSATIYAMGQRARLHPQQARAAVAAALMSSVSTVVLLALMVLAVQPTLLARLALPLGGAAAAAIAVAAVAMCRLPAASRATPPPLGGRAFSLKGALGFGLAIAVVLWLAAAMHAWLGTPGTVLTAVLTGLADAHAAAASVAALVSAGKLPAAGSVVPILGGLTSNALVKVALAWRGGGAAFARQVVPGQVLMLTALWGGAALQARWG
jgi:uncharacterized membrane protein (DUF4010 family)